LYNLDLELRYPCNLKLAFRPFKHNCHAFLFVFRLVKHWPSSVQKVSLYISTPPLYS